MADAQKTHSSIKVKVFYDTFGSQKFSYGSDSGRRRAFDLSARAGRD